MRPSTTSSARATGARGAFAWRDRTDPVARDLPRRRDPFTLTPFAPGEAVRVHDCESAYHEATFALLMKETGGRCGTCQREGVWRVVVVPCPAPVAPPASPEPPPSAGPAPVPEPPIPTIGAADAGRFYGRFVTLAARVLRADVSFNGHVFLVFEDGHRFAVLKAVIFERRRRRFAEAGIDLRALAGRAIRVRGLLQAHPRWGPQILVPEPECLEVPDGA